MAIDPNFPFKDLETKVGINKLLTEVEKLDTKGRQLILDALQTELSENKKQAVLAALRQSVTTTDAAVREWLVKGMSQSYITGVNAVAQIGEVQIGQKSVIPLFKWSDATPEVDTMWEKIRAVAGDQAGTVGDGIYFALDPDSSKDFGNVLHTFTFPTKYKLYDATLASNQVVVGGVTMSKLEHEMYKALGQKGNTQDLIAFAKSKGYSGVIFPADGGTGKWVGLNKEVAKNAVEGALPPVSASGGTITVELLQGAAFMKPHLAAVNALLGSAYADFGNSMTGYIKGAENILNDALKRQIRSTIASGRLEGTAIGDIAKLVKADVKTQGFTVLLDKGGRQWELKRYTEMVTRTHINKAANEGMINRMGDFGVDIVQVSAHGADDRLCAPEEGEIYSLSGNSKNYPAIDGHEPPYHPNCTHNLIPRPDLD